MKNQGFLFQWLRNAMLSLILLGFCGQTVRAQLGPPPIIAVQPLGLSVSSGGTAILTVVAASVTSMSFKWYRNGQVIPGATGSIITLNNVSAADSGSYYVEIRNASGTAVSQSALLLVLLPDTTKDQAQPLPISSAKMTPAGFEIKLSGVTSSKCVIYASTNLTSWTPITTNAPSAGAVSYIDARALQVPMRFYKAMTQ